MNYAIALATAFLVQPLAQQARAAAVEEVEVRLFLSHTGTLSEPVAEDAMLWNTVIGEGGLREPSRSTLVKVLVSGPPKGYDAGAKVLLTVTTRSTKAKKVLSKTLGSFSPDGKQYVAFWLAETGCEELQLEAVASGSNAKIKRNISFRCGE